LKAVHIKEFQEVMRQIYFHRDFQRGVAGTFNWLVEEVYELEEAMRQGDEKALQNEFADVFAWLASLANVVNIDLEQAALQKYSGKCPKCLQTPCNCPT